MRILSDPQPLIDFFSNTKDTWVSKLDRDVRQFIDDPAETLPLLSESLNSQCDYQIAVDLAMLLDDRVRDREASFVEKRYAFQALMAVEHPRFDPILFYLLREHLLRSPEKSDGLYDKKYKTLVIDLAKHAIVHRKLDALQPALDKAIAQEPVK